MRTESDLRDLFAAEEHDVPELAPILHTIQHESRRHRRRFLLPVLAATAVVAVAVASLAIAQPAHRSGSAASQTGGALSPWVSSSFPSFGVSIRHPVSWSSHTYPVASSFSILITYFSNQQLHNPCKTTHLKNNIVEVSCPAPISRLNRAGVLISWTSNSFLGQPQPPAGSRLVVDGHTGGVTNGYPTIECAALGGAATIRATFPTSTTRDSNVVLDACLGPDNLAANRRAVQAMIDSIRFTPDK